MTPQQVYAQAYASAEPPPNAIWEALTTSHHHLAVGDGLARRYPGAVAPFAALEHPTEAAMEDLARLVSPGEAVYLLGRPPAELPSLSPEGVVFGYQMVFHGDTALPAPPANRTVVPLGCQHASEMVALIQLAWPGFFQLETCRMGRYFGVRDADGTLIAMGGERLVLQPWIEISGLCSHPAYPGRGLGSAILAHLLALHRSEGTRSFLHVTSTNHRAVALYQRVGFQTVRDVELHRLERRSV